GQRGAAQPVRRPRDPRGRASEGEHRGPALVAVTEANPLLEGLRLKRTPEPCVVTIFGASGDLTARKLFPALYALAYRRLLPDRFAVVGSARTAMSDDGFREAMRAAIESHARDELRDDVWDWLAERTYYV